MYVLKKGALYVTVDANRTKSSYTNNLAYAKRYSTQAVAVADSCPGNEHVETLEEQFYK